MKYVDRVTIITGLPGSGKTTLAENIKKDEGTSVCVISLDSCGPVNRISFYKHIKSYTYTNHLVVEGLLTGETLKQLLKRISKGKFKGNNKSNRLNVKIISFKKNIEACIFNDKLRGREKSAEPTIRSMKISIPRTEIERDFPEFKFSYKNPNVTLGDISELWGVGVVKNFLKESTGESWGRKIYPTVSRSFKGLSNPSNDLFMVSDDWSNGGSSGNCWNDNISYFEGDTPPKNFEDLGRLLLEIAPDIRLTTYRRIEEECVEIQTYVTHGYYGGSSSSSYYSCNLTKLYRILDDLNLLTGKWAVELSHPSTTE